MHRARTRCSSSLPMDIFPANTSAGDTEDATMTVSLPIVAVQRVAAFTAAAAAGVAIASLGVLHMLRADMSPLSHMISEYALGEFGWLMALCFASFAVSSGSLVVALKGHVRTRTGRIGLWFILLAAIGLAIAAIFPMDPASTRPE